MNTTMFLIILTICATITSILTEAIKKLLNNANIKYACNVLVLIVSIIVGCGTTALFYINAQISFNFINTIYLLLMGIANWVGSMVGYDKVKQAIEQLKNV